ncbi:MAG: hypothetical protein PHO30_00645 [Candidatus Omnitrophica bacterium]|jgi:hypothetical protein|nr:hypothetical protein [Candidatus Omnitrophota bacterium]
MDNGIVKLLVIIWTAVGLGLACYLVYFPIFMKKSIAELVDLLKRIAAAVENKPRKNE